MKSVHSNIVQFRGTHYNFGYNQGLEIKDSHILQNREKQWRVRKPRFEIEEQEVKQAITAFAPGVWDELLGLRDALEWPMEKVLQEFGGYRLEYVRSGCSIVTGDDYFIRNYDYHPKTYEGRYILFQPTDQGYAMIGPSQRITGRPDGMNEKGLVLGYNFMHRKKPGDGFICAMIGRIILESCANVEEAVSMLQEIPHRHSFSYTVFDKSGQTYIVEATPRGTEVRQSNVCTNHFEIMTHENRNYLVDSKRRQEIIDLRKERFSNGYDAFRLMNDRDKGVFSDEYQNWAGTIHTSAYFPKQMEAWMALGGDQEPTKIQFNSWLEGEDLDVEKIIGQVDTDIPFVHMESNVTWYR
ncbi:C45 family autoproteolytic acyltransferase/hydrolase [Aquibacillus koreensis]|uniref:C45 family autoproteolytic acyltransferase/hydrolase n=1 Tax=Aquibacillus koreensis TaxID=279446 RepID=A0A9X3WLR3_9BACI|nr:C45 family peptidase [Aquibacillus koreensis]MCT2537720.1 C45 family autoproteolytic acyltransferase/hydrolase [Aquibacillus koreensis]MDC3420933.1 C45 family autoproteolytic acyltransferase/hydrolase [Aquibacillus koreensis]